MDLKTMARDIAAVFAERGWQWGGPSVNDRYTPDAVDVYARLRRMVEEAWTFDIGTSTASGRLVAERSEGGVAVFLSIGEISEKTEVSGKFT